MANRAMLPVTAMITVLCGGCITSTSIQASDYGFYFSRTESSAKFGGRERNYVSIAGVRIVRDADRSLALVFPSGRREAMGPEREGSPPADAINWMVVPTPILHAIHRLPAVLAADVRRPQQPYATLPLVLIGYGIACIIRRHAVLSGRNIPLELDGAKAVALAIATIALGTFLHCHYFWGNLYQLSAWAALGKILSALAFIGGLAFLIVRVGVLGH